MALESSGNRLPQRADGRESNEGPPSKFVQFLRERGFPKLTNLELSVFYGSHQSAKDAESIVHQLRGADVFIPELASAGRDLERRINDVSIGKATPESLHIPTNAPVFLQRLITLLPSVGPFVAIADLPPGTLGRPIEDAHNAWLKYSQEILSGIPKPRMHVRQTLAARVKAFAEKIPSREKYMADHICPAIVRACAEDPSRNDRSSLKVLISAGSGHTPLSDILRRAHPQTVDLFQEKERVSSFFDEAVGRVTAGRLIPEKMRDNLLMEMLVEAVMNEQLSKMGVTLFQRRNFIRLVVDSLEEVEREEFYQFFSKKNLAPVFAWVLGKMVQKGIATQTGTEIGWRMPSSSK